MASSSSKAQPPPPTTSGSASGSTSAPGSGPASGVPAPRMPRQPKLRSSCDACGAAKLKCDRGQPECGRCISYGLTCHYGVSRKMGKPPRDKRRSALLQQQQQQQQQQEAEAANKGIGERTSITDVSPADLMSFDPTDTLGNFLSFSSLDFGDLMGDSDGLLPNDFHFGPMATPESLDANNNPSPTSTQKTAPSESASRGVASRHDCPQEAHEILGALSSAHALGEPSNNLNTIELPFDHVLRLNREASDRLDRLMGCTCSKTPHLALLCASTISRILTWYQQAAVCMPTPQQQQHQQQAPAPQGAFGTMCPSPSLPSPTSSGDVPPSTWSGSATSSPAVAPAKMTVGSFDVDDLPVQAALKMQLLLGEMRRAERLISQFSAVNSTRGMAEDSTTGGFDGLYQHLDAWLRAEHAKITNMMRCRLRELNA